MRYDDSFMKFAFDQAKLAFAIGEVPVGVVIVKNDKIIASEYNKTEIMKDPTCHAEMLAIKTALKCNSLDDASIYVTIEPCPMCTAAISHTKIAKLYFGAWNPKEGGVRVFEFMSHKPEIYSGIMESETGQLMKDFFERVRKSRLPIDF